MEFQDLSYSLEFQKPDWLWVGFELVSGGTSLDAAGSTGSTLEPRVINVGPELMYIFANLGLVWVWKFGPRVLTWNLVLWHLAWH